MFIFERPVKIIKHIKLLPIGDYMNFKINDTVQITSDTYKGKSGKIKKIYDDLLPAEFVYEVEINKNHRGQFTYNQLKKL